MLYVAFGFLHKQQRKRKITLLWTHVSYFMSIFIRTLYLSLGSLTEMTRKLELTYQVRKSLSSYLATIKTKICPVDTTTSSKFTLRTLQVFLPSPFILFWKEKVIPTPIRCWVLSVRFCWSREYGVFRVLVCGKFGNHICRPRKL